MLFRKNAVASARQYLVDVATQMIEQGGLARAEAEQLVSRVRSTVLRLFPDGAETWDVLYGAASPA